MKKIITKASGLALVCSAPFAAAFSFDGETIQGSFDSTIAAGMGLRTEAPGCNLINTGATGHNPPSGCLPPTSGIGDQGDMNYGKGDLFTNYLKGTHELLLRFPEEYTFMARGSWIRDFAATDTTGAIAANTPDSVGSDGLTSDARDDLRFKARLLDLWVSKKFDIGEHNVRARFGNQVINWGESLFTAGGINATNSYDVMALSRPGTQLKEAVLPAPIFSLASGVGGGVNVEMYYQLAWNKSEVAPVGSYWSTTQALGEGMRDYGFDDKDARNSGQWGLSVRWQPSDTELNLGFYVMRYHDKLPQLQIALDPETFAVSGQTWMYPEDRMLYGISANMPIGDWAVGTELSYRPKEAVPLNPNLDACYSNGGKCWSDEKKLQWHLTGLYSLTPSNSGTFLDWTGASTGTFLSELVVIRYPGFHDTVDGELVSPGLNNWWLDPAAGPEAKGNKTSSGISMDFSMTYDNTIISGWQVTPGVFYSRTLNGRTPNMSATFMQDASNMNLYLNFIRNPGTWQVSLNYAKFMGGETPYDQLLRDRDFVGLAVSRTF